MFSSHETRQKNRLHGPFITAKAREVINGKWGNGQARKDALAAWFVKAVQDEVNRILGG